MSDIGIWSMFDVSVNTPATVFPQELLSRLNLRSHSSSLQSDILKKLEQRHGGEEDREKRAVINTKGIDLLRSRWVCLSASDCSMLIIHLCSR